jgi:hypothetical protein
VGEHGRVSPPSPGPARSLVANPDALPDLRELMAQLAVLMLHRDKRWPIWWRTPGQPPDRDRCLCEEAHGRNSAA